MDYHRYSSLGVGSVPPLIQGVPPVAGAGLPDHVGAPVSGAPPALPVGSSSLLQHHHHPSLMFHYGVGGKPPSLPPHLLPSPSAAVHNSSSNLSSTISTASSHSSSGYATQSKCIDRATTTVPGLGPSLPPSVSTAGGSGGRAVSPNSSSFAAALRTLAKQATGPLVNELDGSYVDSNLRCSPKTVNSYGGTSNGPGLSVPPAVSMTPTQGHPILSADVHKDTVTSGIDMERLAMSEELLRGFQPYRAPDLAAVSSAAQLRPTLPLDLGHSYPYTSLYPHPLTHQYRLEEQLYLERYGLMRPPMAPYGIGGLSSLYQTSPYISTRFPPEIMPNSLPVLHPSSALLHERLKLEEDIRQREYELEVRRERELERERGREREREREKDRRHKDQHDSDKREERQKASDSLRDRSPLSHSSSSLTNANSIASSSLKKVSSSGSNSQQQSRSGDRSKHDLVASMIKSQDPIQRPDPSRYAASVNKQRSPAIVRPFESNPPPPLSNPTALTHAAAIEDKDCKVIKDTHRDSHVAVSSNSAHKSVWQPMQLSEKVDITAPPVIDTHTPPIAPKSATTLNGEIPIPSIVQAGGIPLSYSNIGAFFNQPTPLHSPALSEPPLPSVPKPAEIHGSLQTSVIIAAGPPKLVVPLAEESAKYPPPEDKSGIPAEAAPTLFAPKPPVLDVACSEGGTVGGPPANPICVEISSPEEQPPSPVSRLDLEEQRIRELRETGLEGDDVEEMLFEEMINCPTSFVSTKGPSVPLDNSEKKLSFLKIFDLTTHQVAGEAKLENCERRAKVLEPLTTPMEEEPAKVEEYSSVDKLVPFVAAGLNLCEIPRLKGAKSLLSDYHNKNRFLQKLGMHPKSAKPKQNDVDSLWLIILEERLRRYEKYDDRLSAKLLPTIRSLLQSHRDKDAEEPIPARIKSPPVSPAATKIHENGPSDLTDNCLNAITQNAKSTFGMSSAKMQAALLDTGMKGFLNDGLSGINNILENDPLLSNMSGIEKMIERLVKSAEDNEGKGNSLLLKHIEEVRRSQIAVCQTAQLAQEQVAKLVKTRSQLETHRTSLHHHLSAVSSLLAQTSEPAVIAAPQVTTTSCTSSASSYIQSTSSTRATNSSGESVNGTQTMANSGASRVVMSNSVNNSGGSLSLGAMNQPSPWPGLYAPFLPAIAGKEVTKDVHQPYLPLKEPKMVIAAKSCPKPITTHCSSPASKVSRTPVTKAINKTISSPYVNNPGGKFNGATNSVLSPSLALLAAGTSNALPPPPLPVKPSVGGALPTAGFPPVAVLGMSPSSQLFYVTTTAGSNNNNNVQQRSTSHSINSKGNQPSSKPQLNFTPYSKNSPSKVQNWLRNN